MQIISEPVYSITDFEDEMYEMCQLTTHLQADNSYQISSMDDK